MKLKEARKKVWFSQETIAELCWITRQTYSKMEKWEVDMTVKQFLQLTVFLDITMFDII